MSEVNEKDMEQRIAVAQPKLKAGIAWSEPPQIRFVLTAQTLTKTAIGRFCFVNVFTAP